MLTIKSLPDLRDYLEARRAMVENQREALTGPTFKGSVVVMNRSLAHCNGMTYAYDEALKAVQALMMFDTQHPKEVADDDDSGQLPNGGEPIGLGGDAPGGAD